jgi:TolB protein
MQKSMTTDELRETYRRLHEQLLRGELDEEDFKAQVEQLRFTDDWGNQWKIGWYTGQWYRYDQGQWVQGTPHETEPAAAPASSAKAAAGEPGRRSGTRWLAPLLVGLLVVAALALVAGWYAGWWSNLAGEAVAPTQTTLAPSSTPGSIVPTAGPSTSIAQATPQPSLAVTSSPTRPAEPTSTSFLETMPSATPSAEPATPTPSPSAIAAPALAGEVFFPVYDSTRQTFDIYAYRLADGARRLVVKEASEPAISPNGQRLAYRSWNSESRSIRVQELADGHTWTWVNFAEAARPSWSPDSENLVFPSQQEPDRQWRIYHTMGLESDRVRRHGGDILGRVPVWLADGRIVYWECPQNNCGLYAMQSDGTLPVRLTAFEDDTAPAASPDGDQVAFMSNRDGNWEVYVASTHPADKLVARRLTRSPARDGLPTWSPNGKWLAFVTDRDGSWAVWVTRPDGSQQQKLFEIGGPLEGDIARVAASNQHGWTWESIAWRP